MTDIRLAGDADLPVLIEGLGQHQFFADRLDRQRRGLGELFVAWAGATPVGDVYLWRERPDKEPLRSQLGWTPTIQHLEVLPAWQNRGLGTGLVRAAEEHATGLGYGRVGLGVSVDNPDARRLYERLGYAEWPHGLVDVSWDEPRPDGTLVRQSLACHWMLRDLPIDAPALDDWRPWTPTEAAGALRESTVDWYVAGGWAVDLHLGRSTRTHADFEVAIARDEFDAWRELFVDYHLYTVGAGRLGRLRPGDQPDPARRQIWACDPRHRVWRVDTFLEDRHCDEWACHWLPTIRMPWDEAVARTPDGIAYLRPEYVLLAKAKHRRPKDEADLANTLPTLDSRARDRLRSGLRVADPDHPWLRRLDV